MKRNLVTVKIARDTLSWLATHHKANTMSDSTHYDAIIIGSGIAGLTAGALLARLGKRVLILEQHWIVGGQTHVFKRRGGFEWDVGIHYIGQMERNELPQQVLDYVAGDGLKWSRMPDVFDTFCYPGFEFGVPSRRRHYEEKLIARYPREADNVRGYFEDIKRAGAHFGAHIALGALPSPLRDAGRALHGRFNGLARMTTGDYLQGRFRDPELRTLVASQWGDLGLPPSLSCFGIHAGVVGHYFDGGYYPVGGGRSIAKAIVPTIEASGGQVLTRRTVTDVTLHKGRAVGVRAERVYKGAPLEEVYTADTIISTAGAANTYRRLVKHPSVEPLRRKLDDLDRQRGLKGGPSAVTVYLGLDEDPRSLGVQGENYWIYQQEDHDQVWRDAHRALEGDPQLAYLSFPSLKNPLAKGHTAEVITLVHHDAFSAWQDKPWMNRGESYETLKATIADGLLDLAESRVPGLRERIVHREISTPVTVTDFTAWPAGAFYGLPFTPKRVEQRWLGAHTPIKGLYLGGSDVASMGVMGALMGGFVATAATLTARELVHTVRAMQPREAGRTTRRIWTDDEAPRRGVAAKAPAIPMNGAAGPAQLDGRAQAR